MTESNVICNGCGTKTPTLEDDYDAIPGWMQVDLDEYDNDSKSETISQHYCPECKGKVLDFCMAGKTAATD